MHLQTLLCTHEVTLKARGPTAVHVDQTQTRTCGRGLLCGLPAIVVPMLNERVLSAHVTVHGRRCLPPAPSTEAARNLQGPAKYNRGHDMQWHTKGCGCGFFTSGTAVCVPHTTPAIREIVGNQHATYCSHPYLWPGLLRFHAGRDLHYGRLLRPPSVCTGAQLWYSGTLVRGCVGEEREPTEPRAARRRRWFRRLVLSSLQSPVLDTDYCSCTSYQTHRGRNVLRML